MKKLYLCTCNKTIDKVLQFEKILKETEELFDEVKIVDALCLEEGLKSLAQEIDSEDRLVIGACTSQIIEVPISRHLKSEYIEYVPLREHVAWVHSDNPDGATNKSVVLLSDAATHLDFFNQKTEVKDETLNDVLVIGGGLAGLKATSDLLKLGIGVTLIEPPEWTNDNYLEYSKFMADEEILKTEIDKLLKTTKKAKRIQCNINGIEGHVGRFRVALDTDTETPEIILCGAIIVASNPERKEPKIAKKFHYGKSERVILTSELTDVIANLKDSKILIALDPEHMNRKVEGSDILRVSRIAAKRNHTVIVVHKDIYTEDEELYRSARKAGVIFIRGALKRISEIGNGFNCIIENTLERVDREIDVNIIAIQPIIVPRKGTYTLAEKLGLELDLDGFIKTRYSKMKPVQTSRRGIFVAGNTKMPMSLNDAISSAQNAVFESLKIIRSPIERKGWIPVINEESCDVCKACIEACPNDALRLVDDKVQHIPTHCEFCGICVSVCPTRAIEFQSHGKDSWFARLEMIGTTHKRLEQDTPFTLVYACSECANASIDQAGFAGKEYPTGSYVLQFPCAGMVSPIEILKGLAVGAERVIVAHCQSGGCHHQTGDKISDMVVELTRDMLEQIGQDPNRVKVTYMIAALPNKIQEEVS